MPGFRTSEFIAAQESAWAEIRERFSGNETPNGPGSTMDATLPIRLWLPSVFDRFEITSILDAPCGDWNWLQHVDLTGVRYTGWDIEQAFIDANRERFGQHTFQLANILKTSVPKVDLILCRDFMIHLPNPVIMALLNQFCLSGSRYLAATNHPWAANPAELPPDGHDGRPGYWHRPVNLEAPPFNLTGRIDAVAETGDGGALGQEVVVFDLDAER